MAAPVALRPERILHQDDRYDARAYWSRRLASHYDLQGVGHIAYPVRYNRWLYRRKAEVLDKALPDLRPGARVLDVGSGTGWVVGQLIRRGATVEGCDLEDAVVARLTAAFPAGRFFRCQLGREALPVVDASYDVVTMLDVAYHIADDAEWAAAVADLARVLRPGGVLVVSDGLGSVDRLQAAHVRHRSEARWRAAGRTHGLEVARIGSYFRWLSRPRSAGLWRAVPSVIRGPLEYVLEHAAPTKPHMRWAVLSKAV